MTDFVKKYTLTDDDGDRFVVEFTIRPCGCSGFDCYDDTVRISSDWSYAQADVPGTFGSLLRCILGEPDQAVADDP